MRPNIVGSIQPIYNNRKVSKVGAIGNQGRGDGMVSHRKNTMTNEGTPPGSHDFPLFNENDLIITFQIC